MWDREEQEVEFQTDKRKFEYERTVGRRAVETERNERGEKHSRPLEVVNIGTDEF